nr:hypothetical protein [Hyphomonas sp. Mor2]
MKALSIASILALAITGTACSQSAETPAEPPKDTAEAETATEPEVDMTGFNLGLPTELEPVETIPAGEFNLELGDAATTSTDGFNLETDLGASSGLSDVPEIGASIAEEDAEPEPELPSDDEPVIRLD